MFYIHSANIEVVRPGFLSDSSYAFACRWRNPDSTCVLVLAHWKHYAIRIYIKLCDDSHKSKILHGFCFAGTMALLWQYFSTLWFYYVRDCFRYNRKISYSQRLITVMMWHLIDNGSSVPLSLERLTIELVYVSRAVYVNIPAVHWLLLRRKITH